MEKLIIDLFDELGMQQMIEVPTHEQGNALDLCLSQTLRLFGTSMYRLKMKYAPQINFVLHLN